MREIRERSKKSIVNNLKTSRDDELVTFNLKIKRWEKREIDDLAKMINNEQRPETTVKLVHLVRKSLKILKNELKEKNWEELK